MTVTVVAGGVTQTLTATVESGGGWATSPTTALTNGTTYTVTASVSDVAGNPASATQALTVTPPPTVTISGGSAKFTNNTTPTIVGGSSGVDGQDVLDSGGGLCS